LCEAHWVQDFEQTGEAPRVAIVRRRRQKKLVLKQRRDLPERREPSVGMRKQDRRSKNGRGRNCFFGAGL
jgi:hypothetical protein